MKKMISRLRKSSLGGMYFPCVLVNTRSWSSDAIPKVVPMSEKSAVSWLMGRNCPSHAAHPFGAKL